MGKLHELLAVEKAKVSAVSKLLHDTQQKFSKYDMFQGQVKTLKMLEDSPQNTVIEAAAYDVRQLPTTVHETLDYDLSFWADAEDVIFQKNCSNQRAMADLLFQGQIVAKDVPVDELMGLENRLEALRKLMENMPTLNAGVKWVPDQQSGRVGAWMLDKPEITVKTEKTPIPVVLYEATDHHPAQVKESSIDRTVGTYEIMKMSGAATSKQKAEVLATLDLLLVEVKQARMRANSVEAATGKIGQKLVDLIMAPFSR